jgi:hypothetical protein
MVLPGDSGAPFDDHDEVIARALLDVSLPALLLSMDYTSGDASLTAVVAGASRGVQGVRSVATIAGASHRVR